MLEIGRFEIVKGVIDFLQPGYEFSAMLRTKREVVVEDRADFFDVRGGGGGK